MLNTFDNQVLFITGTDTGVGKTHSALAIIRALQNRNMRVAGMKPVASGCEKTAGGLRNDDALLLHRQAGLDVEYNLVNPYAFAPPIAPHLAAKKAGTEINIETILDACRGLFQQARTVVIEGAGGWRVPLNAKQDFSSLAIAMEAQIILVVGLRLGCLNHALLTAEAIQRDGLELRGWIANHIDPTFDPQGSIDTLSTALSAPLVGRFPYASQFDVAAWARRIRL